MELEAVELDELSRDELAALYRDLLMRASRLANTPIGDEIDARLCEVIENGTRRFGESDVESWING